MSDPVSLEQIEVENLRGFRRVALDLTGRAVFLVGPNNSGKTSLLRILDWVMNGVDDDLVTGLRELTDAEVLLLHPAAQTTGRARRVTLHVRIVDGRRTKSFQAVNGVARLRFRVTGRRLSLHLGQPRRGEAVKSDPKALDLLRLIRDSEQVVYVPNARDTSSGPFRQRLRALVLERLRSSFAMETPGRPNKKVRTVRDSLDALRDSAQGELGAVVAQFSTDAAHLFNRAELEVAFSSDDALCWLADAVTLRLTTGRHDVNMVPVQEVGSGLQSLLMIGLLRSVALPGRKVRFLLEEPETFLHPAAQRELARSLLDDADLWFMASTHSAAMLDEATVSDVVILRDHRLYRLEQEATHDELQSAYMSGPGAEALFARSVLLVEGSGDLAVFETWRRRLSQSTDLRSACSQLAVVPVGGKTAFVPWLQLLKGFVDRERQTAIHWLVLADGDAFQAVVRCFNKAGLEIPEDLRKHGRMVEETYMKREPTHADEVGRLNAAASMTGIRMHLLPFDLEFAIASNLRIATAHEACDSLGIPAVDGPELAFRLGSKCRAVNASGITKSDAPRRELAQNSALDEMHPEVVHALERWLEPVMDVRGRLPSLLESAAG